MYAIRSYYVRGVRRQGFARGGADLRDHRVEDFRAALAPVENQAAGDRVGRNPHQRAVGDQRAYLSYNFV